MNSSTISNTLLIILIIVVIFVAMNKFNKNNNQNNSIHNELQYHINNDNGNHDITLEKALQIISQYYNGIQKINGKYTTYHYNRFIINQKLKKEVGILLQPILCKLNEIMNKNYRIDDYNVIIKKINDSKTTILYTIDFFVLDVQEHHRIKLTAEIHYKIYSNLLHLNHIKASNCHKFIDGCYLDNKPAITNETMTFHNKNRKEMIVDIETLKNNKKTKIMGQYKTNLEQTTFNNNNKQSLPEKALQRHKWILPKNIIANKDKNAWPCKETKHSWGKFGIIDRKSVV